MSTKKSNSITTLDNVIARAKSKVADVKTSTNDYKTLPAPWSGYEINSANVLRSKKTGKPQQIPTGKKKYLIFNDKGERKSIGPEEIKAMELFKKLVVKNKSVKKEGESKKDVILRLYAEGVSVRDIAENNDYKYNTVYECIYKHNILSNAKKGKTSAWIAEKFGYNVTAVSRVINKYI